MRDEIVRYAHQLESLSIAELSQGAEMLVSRERRYTAALIAHLAEISRRKGHLELGFKSLFDYCQIHLGLGKGSVWARTQLANVSRRFPQVLQHLIEGKASLSSLGVLAAHLSEENVEKLLMPEIFEKALDLALEKMDPKQKLERRRKREAARSRTRPDEASPPKTRLDRTFGFFAAGTIFLLRRGSSGRNS